MKKQFLSLLMVLSLLIGMFPASALAAEPDNTENAAVETVEASTPEEDLPDESALADESAESDASDVEEPELEEETAELLETTASGTCGDDLTWALDSGTLTISGTGAMTDWSYPSSVPWYSNRTSITEAIIESGVTSIGSDTFYNCINLTDVKIPDSVATIGKYAFLSCTKLTNITIPNNVIIISDDAFHGCANLTSITIPDKVTSIGDYAFYNCTSLTSVSIGENVISIGDYAFSGCANLTSVTIPDSVITIGKAVFYECADVTNVDIGDSVTFVDDYTFKGCASLTSIVIPNKVTNIGSEAFYQCTGLTNVTIGSSVANIGNNAFRYCTGLTSITIPDSVTDIGEYAFEGCINLTNVTIGNSVTSIRKCTFQSCTSLTSVMIPDSVTSISDHAFCKCTSLTNVTIPDGVQSIGGWAFSGCTGLTRITIPNSVTSIDQRAFSNCTGLTSVTIGDSMTIGNGVTSIGFEAFYDCTGLTSVTIGNSVTSIGSYAFYNCTGLTSMTIPDSVTSIGSYAFYNCTGLTNVTISGSVTSIGEYTFSGCTGLTSVGSIGGGYCIEFGWTEAIPADAFYGCTSLTSVTIPDGVTSIGGAAFCGCTSLTSVMIPDSVTSISDHAFCGCTSLTNVTILDSVQSIGGWAFSGCTGLTDVYYGSSEEEWAAISIGSNNTPLTSATIHYNSTGPNGANYGSSVQEWQPATGETVDLWMSSSIECSLTFNSAIEIGAGNIYLKDYETDEIVQTLQPDEGFYVDGNDDCALCISISVAPASKLYFQVDADAVVMKDGSVFSGITKENNWCFSTAFGLTHNQDYMSYSHEMENCIGKGDKKAHPIASSALKNKLYDIIGRSTYNSNNFKSSKYDGSCFGFAMVTALNKMGLIDITQFDSKADTLYLMKKPIDSPEANGVRDLINYYYFLQYSDWYGTSDTKVFESALRTNNEPLFQSTLRSIVNKALSISSGNNDKVYVLGISYQQDGVKGHALTLCGCKLKEDGSFALLVQDPNQVGLSAPITISSDYSSMTYKTDTDSLLVDWVKLIDVTEMDSSWLIGGTAESVSLSDAESSGNTEYDILSVVGYGNFTITNAEGETLIYKDGYVSGTMNILMEDFVESGVENYAELVYYVEPSNSYTFSSEDSRSSCTVNGGNSYISVSAENAESVSMDKQNGVSITGDNLTYDVYTTMSDGSNFFRLSGETDKSLSIELNDDGTADISADSLQGVSFESCYEDTSCVFDSSDGKAVVTTTENDGLALSGVEIQSGTEVSTNLEDYGNDGVTAKFHNNTASSIGCVVMVAQYDTNGKFLTLETESVTLSASADYTMNFSETNVVYKTFVVDALNTAKPIGNTSTFTR